jgi:hypothetical protein
MAQPQIKIQNNLHSIPLNFFLHFIPETKASNFLHQISIKILISNAKSGRKSSRVTNVIETSVENDESFPKH